MSTVTIGKILGWIGFITLLHSAYSTYERMFLKIDLKSLTRHLSLKCYLFLDLSYLKAVEKVPNDMPIEVLLTL